MRRADGRDGGGGLLTALRRAVVPGRGFCEVEPCYLRDREHATMTAVAYELLAQLLQHPGGAEQVNAMRTRWQTDPDACIANLRELITRSVPTSPDTSDHPWPGQYV